MGRYWCKGCSQTLTTPRNHLPHDHASPQATTMVRYYMLPSYTDTRRHAHTAAHALKVPWMLGMCTDARKHARHQGSISHMTMHHHKPPPWSGAHAHVHRTLYRMPRIRTAALDVVGGWDG